MDNYNWSNRQLLWETIPRSVFLTYSQLYLLNQKLPSENKFRIVGEKELFNPFELLTQTYKNYSGSYEVDANKILKNKKCLDVVDSNYGVASRIVYSKQKPNWAYFSQNTDWFWKQIKTYRITQRLIKIVPGVDQVYITASSTLGVNKENSDIDLIIKAKPGMSWLVRVVLKSLLKIFNLDVHSFSGEIGLALSKAIKIIGFNQFSNSIKKYSQERIYKYKARNSLKVDIGLIYTNDNVLPKIFKNETRHLLFHTSMLVSDKLFESDFNFGNLSYEPYNNSFVINTLLNIAKFIMSALSILVYPVSLVIFCVYYLRHKSNKNFMVTFNTICFYPLIYKEGFFVDV